MKIMIFDVPAESGGALAVLNDFYNSFKEDHKNNYIFIVSIPNLIETKNIKVLRYPWIKKSWLHRLYFDNIIAPKLIKKYKVDKVLSLQNVIIPNTKVPQTLYVHNSLPFSEYRFSFFKNRLLWVYQNILSRIIFNSIKKAQSVIVQTKWMKNACVEMLKINEAKVKVIPPLVNISIQKKFKQEIEYLPTFFYPASAVNFKNHKIIVDACLKLKEDGVNNYRVIFTLFGDENKNISSLYKIINEYELPITLIGNITRETVFDYYSKSILIFPSYIETVGLPLVEAKMHGAPILASDCPFSHEALEGYMNVSYFNPFDKNELSRLMCLLIK